MQITLPPELERYVHEKVRSGGYESASHVIGVALAGLRATEEAEADPDYQAYLKREIAKGIESIERGEVGPWDVEEILARGRQRLAERTRARERGGGHDQVG